MARGKPKTTLQDQRDFISALYGDDYGNCGNGANASIQEVDEAIADCEMMVQESIDRADKEEISFWRKMLQENKMCRRKMLAT